MIPTGSYMKHRHFGVLDMIYGGLCRCADRLLCVGDLRLTDSPLPQWCILHHIQELFVSSHRSSKYLIGDCQSLDS